MNFLIQLIVGLVLSLVSTLAQQAFRKKDQQRGTRGTAQIGGKVPQSFLVGTIGVPGKLEYTGEWGQSGKTPNAYAVDVYSFGDLPVSGLAGLYVNGVRVTIPTAGAVDQGYPVPEFNVAGGNKLWWRFRDGSQTTVDAYLLGKFGGRPDLPWTSDMIGRGVPYLTTTALWHDEAWAGFPSFMAELQGIPLYDPRKDSTAGGSGAHRWGQPETYEFSDNNAVIIYNIERGIYYDGAKVWGGDATAAQLPYAVWAAAMDACDEAVELEAGGSEKRFRAGREIFFNERPADVITDLLIGANARISHASDGTVHILVGVPDEPDGAFSDADVLATERVGSIPFPTLDDIVNGAAATYMEPQQAWETKETSPYFRSDLEAEDDGRQQVKGLDLATTFSGTQAQRVLQAVVEESRRFRRHVVALPPAFARFRPLQVLAWTSPDRGYSGKRFLITIRTRDIWGNVVFGLQEIDPADHAWNPATDERPLSFAPVATNKPAAQVATDFQVFPDTIDDNDGNPRRPTFGVQYDGDQPDVEAVEFQVKLDGDPDAALISTGEIPYGDPATNPDPKYTKVNAVFPPGTALDTRFRYQPKSSRPSDWSAWLPVITPDVKFGEGDIYLPDVVEDIVAFVDEAYAFMGPEIRELIDEARRLTLRLADAEFTNYRERVSLTQTLGSITEDMRADYTLKITAATGPGSAIVQRIESLEATFGDFATVTMVNAQSARIDATESSIIVLGGRATTIETALNGYLGANAVSTAIGGLTTLVSTAQTTADGKNRVFKQAGTPSALAVGDLWIHEGNGNRLYRATAAGTGSWVLSDDQRIPDLVNTTVAQGNAITSLQSALTGYTGANAVATAVSTLTTNVNTAQNTANANANAITSLSAATTAGNIATANMRMYVTAGPSGHAARIGFEARAGGSGAYRSASLFLDVPTSTGSPTRVVIVADQFVVTDGSNNQQPFIFSGGVARMNVAHIGTVTAGLLKSSDDKFQIDLTNKFIEIRT